MAESNPNLFIYKLMNNVNSRIIITGLSKEITAYTTQDFGFSASAQWSGRNPNAFMDLANKMEGLTKEVYNRTFGKKFGELATGITLDIAGSKLNYQGTEPFGFTLNLYFIALLPGDDVRKKIGYLAEGLFPEFGDIAGVQGMRLIAPNKYNKGAKLKDISGAIKVRIGKWFHTEKIFVIDNMDFVLSKEIIRSGLPLYAKGSVSFKAARVLSIKEVKSMFGL
jgi:hypothetical protein